MQNETLSTGRQGAPNLSSIPMSRLCFDFRHKAVKSTSALDQRFRVRISLVLSAKLVSAPLGDSSQEGHPAQRTAPPPPS